MPTKQKALGPCQYPGCDFKARFYIGSSDGEPQRWLYVCLKHDRVIATQNVLWMRAEKEKADAKSNFGRIYSG